VPESSVDPSGADRFPSGGPENPPQGKVYRSKGRPGLTPLGVAVIGGGVAVVAALISILVTDTLGWVFTVPFILVCGYCAAEVRFDRWRSALLLPPLALFVVVLIAPWVSGDATGLRSGLLRSITTLTKLAPALTAALLVAGLILGWRRWRSTRG
jgi:hypothetical protein